jgi:hypothetical protein
VGAQGTAILDFGAFPGSAATSVDVAAAGVISTSAIEAWIRPEATADHTDVDHVAAPMNVVGTYLSDGNIRIFGINTNDVIPPLEPQPLTRTPPTSATLPKSQMARQNPPMFVGLFKVNWVWN